VLKIFFSKGYLNYSPTTITIRILRLNKRKCTTAMMATIGGWRVYGPQHGNLVGILVTW